MDGFILLIILIPFIFLIILLTILNRTAEQRRLLESLFDKLKQLNSEVSSLSKELKEKKEEKPEKPAFKETPGFIIMTEKPVVKESDPVESIKVKPFITEPETVEKILADKPASGEIKKQEPVEVIMAPGYQSVNQPEKESDIEKFIGENLANKIGITVLVLGIAFFIKFAIDKNWIHETGRVIIGLISGTILIGLAHYFRNSYRSFSSVLVGGGLSVFYFSIAFAFHEYHIIGQLTAFISMMIVSVLAVILSLFYNRQELAILATIGGFITPFLVSTGNENPVALFTYLSILNAGLIALSWFKRWPAINIISLFFTTIIFGGWLISRLSGVNDPLFPYEKAFLFATVFYLLFVTMNIINCIRLKSKFTAFNFIILLSINFLYYIAGMFILDDWNAENAQGLFTLSLGLFNLLLTAIFFRKKEVDRNFVFLLLGLSLTFISLTAPVQFRGNHIVLCWAAESLLLLFLYQRSKIQLLKMASCLVMAAMFISLFMTWLTVYFPGSELMPVIFNKGFITSLAVSAVLFIYQYRVRKEQDKEFILSVPVPAARNALLAAATLILYLSGMLEINYQFSNRFPGVPLYAIYIQAYTFAFVFILLLFFKANSFFPRMKFLLTVFCFGLYIFHIPINQQVSLLLLSGNGNSRHFFAHWAADIFLFCLLCDLAWYFFKNDKQKAMFNRSVITWIACSGIVLVLSIEMYYLVMWFNFRNESDWAWWRNLYEKAGLSILWSSCSFILMWMGMKYGFRTWRIISLTLFTITLAKLFIYDIRNIPPGGKIAAFILLGVLLLAVSFMYQRLKRIIIDHKKADQKLQP